MQIPGWLQTNSVPSSVAAGCHGTVHAVPTRSPQTIWNQHGQYRQFPTICPVLFCNDFSIPLSWANNYSQHAKSMTNTKKNSYENRKKPYSDKTFIHFCNSIFFSQMH